MNIRIYIVLDTKDSDDANVIMEYSQIVNTAKSINPDVLDRMIPQVYSENMYWTLMDVYPFKSVIYTLYQEEDWTRDSVYEFCFRSGIRFVTLKYSLITEDIIAFWKTLGIKTGVHTVNDEDLAQNMYDMGVDIIYTDFLYR